MKQDLLKDLERYVGILPYREALGKAYESLESVLKNELYKKSLEELQVEYTGLFLYGRPHISCPPYESVYREKKSLLFGESTVEVKKFYNRFKINVSKEFKDLPDHIAAELEFMHFLSFNDGMSVGSGRNDERNFYIESEKAFLENHMLKWIPKIAGCLEKNVDSKLYMHLTVD